MATIKEVSALAGVSASTVSNVLNGRGYVAEATRNRVLEVVDQLGYTANIHAQQLVTQRSRILAIKLPDLSDIGGTGIPNSSYFLNIVNGATAAANEHDYALVVLPSGASQHTLRRFSIDGFIVVDPLNDDPMLVSDATTVTIGATKNLKASVGLVDNDHAAALRIAMQKFAEKQRNKTAVISDPTNRPYIAELEQAYHDWANETKNQATILELDSLSSKTVKELVEDIVSQKIDSVYAVSDEISVAILKAARELNLDVPNDLAIISAVDSANLSLTTPTISAMELYPIKTGRAALSLLVAMIENKKLDSLDVVIPVDYLERESL